MQYAPTKHGERYVACAILACDTELAQQVDLANLASLSSSSRWVLSHFGYEKAIDTLLVKANSDLTREFDSRYQRGTPTMGVSIPDNRKSLRNNVHLIFCMMLHDLSVVQILFRDGFQCHLTGWYDCQARKDLVPRIRLEVAHISVPSPFG